MLLSACTVKPRINFDTNKVFRYQFAEPSRVVVRGVEGMDLSPPKVREEGLAANEYYSANGYYCRKIPSEFIRSNIICYIGNTWRVPATIGIAY